MEKKPKLIAVVGPTASGKSGLALKIAQQHNGELIIADSRQIYKGLDVGSAKDIGEWEEVDGEKVYLVDGIREHLVDIRDPNDDFTVVEFQEMAFEAIDDVIQRGKLPILVGGTGLYIQSIIENLTFPSVPPNELIRERLNNRSLMGLQRTFEACDPVGAASLDMDNKRRLVRAIEVCMVARKPFSEMQTKGEPRYEALQLAFELPRESLYMRIEHRTRDMVYDGLIKEVQDLVDSGANVIRNAMSGIGYRETIDYLQGEMNREDLIRDITKNTRRLAKRQLSWFRRDPTVRWVIDEDEGLRRARHFLES